MSVKEKYAYLPPLPRDLPERLSHLPELLARHPARLGYLFGSAAQKAKHINDIDLAVLPEEGFSYEKLYADLSLALNTDRLDLVDLQVAPLYLQAEVVEKGKCLWARSEEERLRFEQRVRLCQREESFCFPWQSFHFAEGGRLVRLRRKFIERTLAEMERVVQELKKYQTVTDREMAKDLSLRWTVERGLLAGLTLMLQIADHIPANHFRRTAETCEGLLAERNAGGAISDRLYDQIKGVGRFRNVLVYEYVTVDLNKAAPALHQASEIMEAFRGEVKAWLNALTGEKAGRLRCKKGKA